MEVATDAAVEAADDPGVVTESAAGTAGVEGWPTADAAAAEYLIGGNIAGTALGIGATAGGEVREIGADPPAEVALADLVGAVRPVGRVAVPSRVGFR